MSAAHRRTGPGAAALLLALALIGTARGAERAVVADPATPRSAELAAALVEIRLDSAGSRLNGLLYRAAGIGPHPVVLVLHGFPGNERNLDLAQALRRAGNDVLYFDYRGTWGSAGRFTFGGGIDDVAAALAWVRDPAHAASYHFDTSRIRLVGHSYGGWLTLNVAARDAGIGCVATLAAWNAGYAASRFDDHPDERAARLTSYGFYTEGEGAPIKADAQALVAELAAHAQDYDTRALATALAQRHVLLIGATRDSLWSGAGQQQELGAAIRAAGGRSLRVVRYEDDHSFSSHRIAATSDIVHWLAHGCGDRP